MKLEVISDHGSEVRVVADGGTREAIQEAMASLDWNNFHQVVLTRANDDWLEVGGSLNPKDGLSVMFEENGEQFVIKESPSNVAEMTSFLLGYLADTEAWKRKAEWE